MASRLLWVRLNHGEAGLETLKTGVSGELLAILEGGIDRAKWYPVEQFIELNLTIDEQFGTGDLALIKELGRHSADANLSTVFRLFLKVGTVKWILARASRLWGLHYDSGYIVVREFPDEEVELEIVDFLHPSRVHCLSVQGWAERAAELSGGRDIKLDEVDCRAHAGGERCRFRIRWR